MSRSAAKRPKASSRKAQSSLPLAEAEAPNWAVRAVLAAMALYALGYSALSIRKLDLALYTDFDLAIFAHATSQLTRWSLYESIGGMRWLGGHAALNLFLVAPLYAIARTPVTLLVLQSIALATGAWPVYKLARRELGGAIAPVLFAFTYLIHPALGYMNLFEFHPETLAVPALLFVILAVREGRLRPLVAWATFAALAREDVSFLLIALAIWAAIANGNKRWAVAVALASVGLVALIATYFVIMPAMSAGSTDYAQMYSRWGTSTNEVVRAVLTQPLRAFQELFATPNDPGDTALKRLYFLQLLLPVGFLALLSPICLLTVVPIWLEHFLSSRPSQHSIVFHYTALVLPSLFGAVTIGAGSFTRWISHSDRGRATRIASIVAGFALVCALASNVLFGPIANLGKLQGISRPEALTQDDYERSLDRYRKTILKQVPKKGDVVAGFELLSRYSDRPGLHALHHFLSGQYTFSTRPFEIPSDVGAVVGDLGRGSLFKHVNAGTARRWRELMEKNHLKPIAMAQDFVLFTRNPADTVELCVPAEPPMPLVPPVTYDGQISLTGYASPLSRVEAGGILPLQTYWRRNTPTSRLYLSEFLIFDEAREPVWELWRYLGYTLYPADDWQAGVNMRENYNLIVPHQLERGRYSVAVRLWWRENGQGVCIADDPSAAAREGFVVFANFEVVGAGEQGR